MKKEAPSISTNLKRSIRRLKLTGYAVIFTTFIGFGGWAALAPLAAAAIAIGQVSPDGSQRTIQHLEGGIVHGLHVREGSKVRKGDPLVTLDKAQAEANYRSKYRKLQRLLVMRDRLLAEERGDNSFDVDATRGAGSDQLFEDFVANEIAAFRIKRKLLDQKREVYERQEQQVENEIASIEAQSTGMTEQLKLIEQEIAGKQTLLDKGLVRVPEMLALQRKQAELLSESNALASTIARARQKIEEIRVAKITVQTESLDDAVARLTEVNSEIASVEEALSATSDILDRTEILAPIDGTVLELHHRTIGGVVRPGEPIMTIVPDDEELIVDARLGPRDIDNVAAGMTAKVQITSFMARHLLPLDGTVTQIGADVITDPNTQETYYPLRIRVDQTDLERTLGETPIQPGMPTEVFVQTGTHTLLRYFADPILHSFNRAFREEVVN